MANPADYENAAKKLPSNRDSRDQALVDEGRRLGMLNVKNLDHEAQRNERIFGH